MNSITTPLPFDYYYLDICQPEKLITVSDNIGLLLSHEITYKTNYEITLNENSYCKILCKNKFSPLGIELIKWMIRRDYVVKFYLDKLPAGLNLFPLIDVNGLSIIQYSSGIPLGYVTHDNNNNETIYIYNHFTFNVKVHYEKKLNKYTIVGFDIIPSTINHEISSKKTNDNNSNSYNNTYSKDIIDNIDKIENDSKNGGNRYRSLQKFLEDEKNKMNSNSISNLVDDNSNNNDKKDLSTTIDTNETLNSKSK